MKIVKCVPIPLMVMMFMLFISDAQASARCYADPLTGFSMQCDNSDWDVKQSPDGGRALLKPRRANDYSEVRVLRGGDLAGLKKDYEGLKIASSARERLGGHLVKLAVFTFSRSGLPMKGIAMGLKVKGITYRVDCISEEREFTKIYFSCRDLVRNSRIEEQGAKLIEDSLYAYLSGAVELKGMSRVLRLSSKDSLDGAVSDRFMVIIKLMDGDDKKALGFAKELVSSRGDPVDYVLLSLASHRDMDVSYRIVSRANAMRESGLGLYWAGVVSAHIGRFGLAREHFMDAYRKSRLDLAAFELAKLALADGNFREAKKWWKRIDDSSIIKAALTIKLARMDGALEDALAVYDENKVLFSGRLGAEAATDASLAAFESGQFSNAERLLKKAISHDPSYKPAYKALARLKLQKGDELEGAVAILKDYERNINDMVEKKSLRKLIDEIGESSLQ